MLQALGGWSVGSGRVGQLLLACHFVERQVERAQLLLTPLLLLRTS